MTPVDSLEGLHDTYRVTRPGEIFQVLRDIQEQHKSVILTLPQNQKIVSMLLEVKENSGEFVYDCGRNQEESRAVLSTGQIHFATALRGISVRFSAPTPAEMTFAGKSAFLSPLPFDMLYFQRRQYYRADVKLNRSYPCTARLANETLVSLNIRNISLGGVGLQSNAIPPEDLPVGSVLKAVVLDFLELGKLEVAMRVVSHQKGGKEGAPNHFYGCKFEHLPKSKEASVQRLVFSLEILNRANTWSLKEAAK